MIFSHKATHHSCDDLLYKPRGQLSQRKLLTVYYATTAVVERGYSVEIVWLWESYNQVDEKVEEQLGGFVPVACYCNEYYIILYSTMYNTI